MASWSLLRHDHLSLPVTVQKIQFIQSSLHCLTGEATSRDLHLSAVGGGGVGVLVCEVTARDLHLSAVGGGGGSGV